MSDYKRITRRNEDGTTWVKCVSCDKIATCDYTKESCCQVLQNRLAELEDKIENGTLIELPCKVGDAIFFVYDYGSVLGECIDCDTGIVSAVKFQADGIWIYARYESGLSLWHKTTDIGTKIFLTQAEAEAKLEELKRGQE